MPAATQSQYIRINNQSAILRRWIATILLRSHLESHVVFTGLDGTVVAGFDTSNLTRENREDAEYIRAWLASELERCPKEAFEEDDVFIINTRRIAKSIGLNKVELAVLRFACLLTCYKPLEAASEIGGSNFTEADVCELLAELLELPFSLVYRALQPSGVLRSSGLVRAAGGWSGTHHLTRWLMIPDMIAREIFRPQDDDNLLINVFYTTAPKSSLTQHDFPQRQELGLIKSYLRASIRDRAVGANVLIWGPPGTGKTEMARHVAQVLRKKALEINTVNADGEALTAVERLDCYRFCQAILARSSNALVVFDEVEEVLSDSSFTKFGFKEKGGFAKGLMNSILETNATPAIWITNTVGGVDPAYLRRFDLVVNLKTPVEWMKRKIAFRTLKDLPISTSVVSRMVRHRDITPAHFDKVSRICTRIGVSTPEEGAVIATQVLNGDLRAIRARPLEEKKPEKKKQGIRLPYRPDLINCDTDVEQLAANLSADCSVRICSFGPPGTGKTAWARHLAESVGRPLLVRHAADILDKYIGGTEEKIVTAFREATDTNSVLMLDEVDGFLPDRANATRHWEITQANQFLTAMEEFDGILVCATNLIDNLDPATMRRFDFKIRFDYLGVEQACELARELLGVLGVTLPKEDRSQLRFSLSRLELSHGDFAVVLRRYAALKLTPGWRQLVEDLEAETSFRQSTPRPIGFLAGIQ